MCVCVYSKNLGYCIVEAVAADGIEWRVLSRVVGIETDGIGETLHTRRELAENISVYKYRPVTNFDADARSLSVEIPQQTRQQYR